MPETKPGSIRELYRQFDKIFKKPDSFFNKGCCVEKRDEKYLLNTALETINEEPLSHAFNHYRNCFGDFEQLGYYLPRLIEIARDNKGNLGYCISFWSLLIEDKPKYKKLNLLSCLSKALDEIYGSSGEGQKDWVEFKKTPED